MNKVILVVAREGAKLFEQSKFNEPIRLAQEFPNPEGKKQNKDLSSDKPGRSFDGGASRHSLTSEHEPREELLEKFLRTLAKALDKKLDESAPAGFVVIADPHITGMLRPHLSKRVSEKVEAFITKNLFHADDKDILEHARGAA